METITITCYVCKGKGKTMVVDLDGYGEEQNCLCCNGLGTLEEPHPKYL